MTAVDFLQLGVECYLRELDDIEYDALIRRVRPAKARRYPAKGNRRRDHLREVL
ncbi:hypothetical protein [Mycolicibacterium sphagni]|uniref:hypothetical protein n=1 Tax=Mycolicibacterium sphagni TaxID=1786 RepID=UPI0021F2FB94|nr:hypothetical protein [Mycolicibacterium sphagni]MCV7176762.1 hypothetical protein [Mycolicibacterium sphagni]